MVEVFIPPVPEPGIDPIRVFDDEDVREIVTAFVCDPENRRDDEVIMTLLGVERQVVAVVAFGSIALDHIVDDPRPLVAIASGSGCHSVVMAQVGRRATDVVEERRALGAALAVDDIELESWIDVATAS